ncbi:hypothetical protein AB0L88_34230 [Saccharopolyspora shandongensis]|uniref:Uncharacterized protein n=1 Tax=Saccharopolyspora shandongensis TaxID=418495 RepID=A0A1H3J5Z1_9PSEU|nr:hypothetical protein [Saccharopolyspora shandongensis]SDY35351.1 hypothetical protein SAMN05216215_102516 [Saccharopolyspora shandongensis]
MNHEDLIRKFDTPSDGPDAQARRQQIGQRIQDMQERGEVVSESLAQRHAEVPLPTKPKPSAPRTEPGADG